MDQRLMQKQTRNALERLDELEKTLPQVVNGFQQAVNQLQQGLNGLTEIMDAVIGQLGADKISASVTEARKAKAEAAAEQDKKALDQALLEGAIAVAEAISEKTIIVGKEVNADGTVKAPGYVQAPFMRIDPKFQEQIKGQKAGFSFDLPTGGKFSIDAIYDVVPQAADPVTTLPAPGAPEGAN